MNQTFSRLYASQLVTGRGSLSFLATLGKKKAAIIYDGRIIGEEKQRQITHLLNTGGCEVRFVADIRNEPFFSDITSAGEELRSYEPDLFVAIGGGSVMDTTKAMWLFYEHPELTLEDSFKPFALPPTTGKAIIVAVPTTSGTGSETTCCAVFTNQDTLEKRLMLSYEIMPAFAILDADFTDTMPDVIAAHTGMDALTHALEAAVCTAASPLVQTLSLNAALDMLDNLPFSTGAVLGTVSKADAREMCHIGATIAGIAINNCSAGLAHALDQPGPYFGLPHGMVCGLLLPYTTAFHSPHPAYVKVGRRLGFSGTDQEICQQLVDHLWKFVSVVGVPHSFKEAGADEAKFMAKLPDFVAAVDTSMAANLSPKKPTPEEATQLLKDAYYGNKPHVK